jgi:signal transduction histidine kinase
VAWRRTSAGAFLVAVGDALAVRELLVNAVEHGEGAVTVAVDCADEARVTVRDEGPGVPAPERDVVTGATVETALDHSDGLGLWMAKWVVESFGGGIRFHEGGSAVTVWVAS